MTPFSTKDTLSKSPALTRLQQLDRRPFHNPWRHHIDSPSYLRAKEIKELSAINCSAVARLIGVSPSPVLKTLKGQRRNQRVRRALCAASGLTEQQIWPEKKAS